MTTFEQFIRKVVKNHYIEFSEPAGYDGYRFTVTRLTKDGRLYKVQMSITSESVHDMSRFCDPWDEMYQQIVHMMSKAMQEEYPEDKNRGPRALVEYVKDFIKEHEIHSGEKIHQSDELNLAAPDFMDRCCEIIGYYEES